MQFTNETYPVIVLIHGGGFQRGGSNDFHQQAILDNFGADGWELVQVVPGPTPENLVAYFKRAKS